MQTYGWYSGLIRRQQPSKTVNDDDDRKQQVSQKLTEPEEYLWAGNLAIASDWKLTR